MNPVMLWTMAYVGFVAAVIAFKAAALAILGAYYLVVSQFNRILLPSMSLVPVCAAYIAIVLNNYS
jgi:hypothetical protein